MGAARIGSALVGQQHELFDHALRHTAGALDDIHAAAFLVHDQLGFVGFDVHRAACFAQSQALFVQLGHRGQLSHVYRAMGLDKKTAAGVLRVSFGPETTKEEIDALISALKTHRDTRFPML